MNRTGEKGTLITYERALFIQAEIRIVRNSTNERKQMSTKTTFKRIALVAVAALGLGVLSVAPSSATPTGLAIAVTNGTSTIGGAGNSDSSTAGTVNVTSLYDATSDSVTVQLVLKSKPATGADIGRLYYLETSTPLGNGSVVESVTATSTPFTPVAVSNLSMQNTGLGTGTNMYRIRTGAVGYVGKVPLPA